MRKITILLFSLALFNACDKIDDPIPDSIGTTVQIGDIQYVADPSLNISTDSILDFIASKTWDSITGPNNSSQRFVVLEEFTGHKCRACPNGAREIQRLVGEYGDQLIPIAIHSTNSFAAPEPSGNMYRTDFRLQSGKGETYRIDLNIGALPQGIVSRTTTSGRQISQWEGDFLALKDDSPVAALSIKSFYTSSDSFLIRVQLEIEWLVTLPETYKLQVDLLESNIIDWQLDGTVDIEHYNHKHVLRKLVNDTYGIQLKTAVAGERENFQYITTLSSAWKPENMEVVAFIFDSDPNSYKIVQANAVHVRK
ncbi:MAG: Omp28-related outer membrane protein [Flavobacteriales bacterium]|nr:Omp28-related outer membrane protein [Flavobacteriales bacterium]